MSYIDNNLMANEVVVYRTRLHWATFMSAIVVFVLAIAASFSGMQEADWILYLIAAGLVLMNLITYVSSEFGVTNRRVIIKVGFVRRNSYEMLLNRIEGIEVAQSILGRILGYGTIVIRGMGGSQEVFSKIENPLEFRKKVQEQIAELPQNQ